MKIFLAQQNYHIGNFESNTNKIIEAINIAKQSKADLVVFSELCICGYPPRDFVEFSDFINKCYQAIDSIKEHADTIGVLVGAPDRNTVPEGKDLFNAAYLLYDKQIQNVAHKTCLPTYDVFDEYRYFEPAFNWKIIEFKGKKLAVTICEDIWNLGDNPLYRICPMDILMQQSPDVMINLSASPFDYNHDEDRKATIKSNVVKYKLPMFYCNAVGSQTEIVFDGASLIFDKDANLCMQLLRFKETIEGVEWKKEPEVGDVPLIADASSDILSHIIPVDKYALIYAGAQKNMGPSGVTVVIIRDDMLSRIPDGLHTMLDYRTHAENNSLYNTPNTWGIYIISLVTKWITEKGGLAALQKENEEKAQLLYDAIDASDFYRGHADPDSRSIMNVTFRLPSEELEKKFASEATAKGLDGLKGHRSVGGIRASIYNAFPRKGVEALVSFMSDFERGNG